MASGTNKLKALRAHAAETRIEDGLVVIGITVGFMVVALEFMGIGI